MLIYKYIKYDNKNTYSHYHKHHVTLLSHLIFHRFTCLACGTQIKLDPVYPKVFRGSYGYYNKMSKMDIDSENGDMVIASEKYYSGSLNVSNIYYLNSDGDVKWQK